MSFQTFNLFNFFQQPNTGIVPIRESRPFIPTGEGLYSGRIADFNWPFKYSDTATPYQIYRAGKFPKYPKLYYVEIEKLDTKKFIENWDNLEMDLEEMGVIDLDNMNGLDQLYLDGKLDLAISDEILDRLADYNRKFIIELLKLVKNCESVVGGSGIIDFHKYNFGYDKKGTLKCLDI